MRLRFVEQLTNRCIEHPAKQQRRIVTTGAPLRRLRADDVLPGLLGEPLLEAYCAVRQAEADLFASATPDLIAEATRWRY